MSATAHARIASLAADRSVHRAFHWLHLHALRLRQWQMEMIAIPAPTFAESARANWFLERFNELGLTGTHIDAVGNVLGWLPAGNPSPGAPCVLISAHLDTVFPAETDCTPYEDGAVILGPGACDNAAGLTALLGLAAALQFAHITPPNPILFCANVGEEGEGDLRGMRAVFADKALRSRVSAALALEGSGNATIVDRALGSKRLRITVEGPGGHSWADASQPNPIFALAAALAAVAQIELPAVPRTTLHCGTIAGGTSVNSVPESVTATLDIRSTDAEQLAATSQQAIRAIQSSLVNTNARSAPRQPLALQIETIGERPAGTLSPDSALMTSLRAVDRHLNIATEQRIGSTDANLPISLGVQALAIGAGGTAGGIHTQNEWYDPTGREHALRRILLLLLDLTTLEAH